MKKKYMTPIVGITSCHLEYAVLAGSDPSRDPSYVVGPDGSSGGTGGGVTETTDKDEPKLGAKGFTAWESWDE